MGRFFANPMASGLLATLLLATPLFWPILALTQIIAPLPILATALLAGVPVGMQAVLVPLGAGLLFTEDLFQAILLVVYINGFTLLSAWLMRGGWTTRHCIGGGLLLALLIMLAGALLLSLGGADISQEITQHVNTYRDQVLTEGADLLAGNPTGRVHFQETVTLYAEMMARFLPAVVLSVWFLIQVVNLALAKNLLARLNQPLPETTKLADWRLPYPLVWVLIVAMLCTMIDGNVAYLGANLLLFLTVPYAVQGVVICNSALHRFGLPPGLRMAFWVSLILFNGLMVLIIILGILDTWFDFRRLLSPKGGSGPSTR